MAKSGTVAQALGLDQAMSAGRKTSIERTWRRLESLATNQPIREFPVPSARHFHGHTSARARNLCAAQRPRIIGITDETSAIVPAWLNPAKRRDILAPLTILRNATRIFAYKARLLACSCHQNPKTDGALVGFSLDGPALSAGVIQSYGKHVERSTTGQAIARGPVGSPHCASLLVTATAPAAGNGLALQFCISPRQSRSLQTSSQHRPLGHAGVNNTNAGAIHDVRIRAQGSARTILLALSLHAAASDDSPRSPIGVMQSPGKPS